MSSINPARRSKDIDVRKFVTSIKLSFAEVCKIYNVDIENDNRNAFFWNILENTKVSMTDELLDWCGYKGSYKTKKAHFLSLLKKNFEISYGEVRDEKLTRRSYLVLESLDFESLLMQMRSKKAQEIRELYSFLKYISKKYIQYEKYFEQHQRQLVSAQNNQLTQSVNELKDLVLQVKSTADREIERAEEQRQRAEEEHQIAKNDRQRAEEDRQRAEEHRQRADEERQRADEERQRADEERQNANKERQRAEEERRKAEERHAVVSNRLENMVERIRTQVALPLRERVAPLVTPAPINTNKQRCLALLCLKPGEQWYIVRRQRETFKYAVNAVLHRHPGIARLIREWYGVPHSIDIGNSLKAHLRDVKWFARGNILKTGDQVQYTDDELAGAIDVILQNNIATELSDTTMNIIQH